MITRIFALFVCLFGIQFSGFSQKDSAFIHFPSQSKVMYGICFTRHGEAIGIADSTQIRMYSTDTRQLLGEFINGHKSQILTIDISPDSLYLVSGGRDSLIVLWDLVHRKVLHTLTHQKGIITSLKFSPDGRCIASGGSDKKVYVYDIAENKIVNEWMHEKDVTSVTYSPDGRYLASTGGDKTIRIYEPEKGTLVATLKGHKNWIRDIAFNDDGTKLISCGDDARVIQWNLANKNKITFQKSHRLGIDWFLSLSYNQDGKFYALGGMDGKLRITGSSAKYSANVGVPIHKVCLQPGNGIYLKALLATRGKGVILISARNMKYTGI